MDTKRRLIFSQRKKYLLVITATLSPIVSFMFLVFLTSYRPVFSGLENIVDKSISEIQPIHNLQISILNAVMPPNDYLIHASEEELENWRRLKSLVDNAFVVALEERRLASKRRYLIALKQQWIRSRTQGDMLFQAPTPASVHKDSAVAMEAFDESIDQISRQLSQLLGRMEEEIQKEHRRIEKLKIHGLALTGASILLGMALGIIGSTWLTKERKRIVGLSFHDELTGVYNRRALEREIAKMKQHQLAYHPPCFAILMIDIDHFKDINDQHGHDAGDIALKAFANHTKTMIRTNDVFGRYGGEEFLILLPEATKEEARELAERIRLGIESSEIELPGNEGHVQMTVSIGGAVFSKETSSVENAIKTVDQAMYQAKQNGRNQVVFA